MTRFIRASVLLGTLLGLSVLSGCGGGAVDPNAGRDEDQTAVADVVSSLGDVSGTLDRLRAVYAKDAAPTSAQQQDIKKYFYVVEDPITINGTTASFNVKVFDVATDSPPNLKAWTAVKDGADWKLKDTPVK